MSGPAIEIGSLRIDEFMGTLTDVLVALFSFFLYTKLKQLGGEKGTRALLLNHFLLFAIGTFLGGVLGHGFLYFIGPYGKLPGFVLGIIAVFLLELAILRIAGAQLKPGAYRMWYSMSIAVALSCIILTFWSPKFMWTALHAVYGILIVVGGLSIHMLSRKLFVPAFKNILIGIGVTLLSSLIFVLKISPHTWFNQLDFSHLFLGIATWFFYRGAKHLLENTRD